MPLAAPSLAAFELEERLANLFEEWLRGYFDGADHAVGAQPALKFPVAELRFQQSALSQPLKEVGITWVWVAASNKRRYWDTIGGTRQEISEDRASWFFFIRTNAAKPEGNADRMCRTVADRLHGLLGNSAATRALAQRGVHQVCPGTPQLLSEGKSQDKFDPNYITRLITCRGLLRYPLLSQI